MQQKCTLHIFKSGDDELGDDVAAQSVPDGEDDVDVDLGDNDVGDQDDDADHDEDDATQGGEQVDDSCSNPPQGVHGSWPLLVGKQLLN